MIFRSRAHATAKARNNGRDVRHEPQKRCTLFEGGTARAVGVCDLSDFAPRMLLSSSSNGSGVGASTVVSRRRVRLSVYNVIENDTIHGKK